MSKKETIKKLNKAEYNPRKITLSQLESLEKTLKEFGDLSGIVFNIATNTIVGGHQRIRTLPSDCTIVKDSHTDETGTVSLGYIETPQGRFSYREVNWDIGKEKAANIAANKAGGSFDNDKLKDLLFELDDMNFDMELTAFDKKELEKMLNDSHLDNVPDSPPGSPEPHLIKINCPKCSHEIHVLTKD